MRVFGNVTLVFLQVLFLKAISGLNSLVLWSQPDSSIIHLLFSDVPKLGCSATTDLPHKLSASLGKLNFFDSSIFKVIEGTMNSTQCSNKALSFDCTSQKWWREKRVVLSCDPETSSLFCWDCFCLILHCKFPLWTVWMKIVEMKMTCSCNFVFPHSLPLLGLHLFIVLKLFS